MDLYTFENRWSHWSHCSQNVIVIPVHFKLLRLCKTYHSFYFILFLFIFLSELKNEPSALSNTVGTCKLGMGPQLVIPCKMNWSCFNLEEICSIKKWLMFMSNLIFLVSLLLSGCIPFNKTYCLLTYGRLFIQSS